MTAHPPAERVEELARRIEALTRAGKLRDVTEPVGVDLFEPLPPLEEIETRQVYQSAAPGSVHAIADRVRYRKMKAGARARAAAR